MSRRIVGTDAPVIEGISKVTGKAKYEADEEGRFLVGKILRSPYAHAIIKKIDTAAALRIPGVKAVLTFADTPQIQFGRMVKDEYILAKDKVRYVGDEVAAVAALNEETATLAMESIEVEYEILPSFLDPESAMDAKTGLIHDKPYNIASSIVISRGNLEQGFAEADLIIENEYRTSLVHQGYLENNTCTAEVDSCGILHLSMPNQCPFRTRSLLAKALALPESKVRITSALVGGAFGGKTYQRIYAICGLLALKTGQKVRITNERETDFACGVPRVPAIIQIRSGVNKNGKITAKETKIIADNGAYTISAPAVLSTMAYRVDSLYRLQNVRTEAVLVYTNKVPTGMYRGFGNPQMTFAWERQMDIMAEKLGLDPLEFRLLNASEQGDITAHGWELNTCGYKECLQKAAELSAWNTKRNSSQGGSKRKGIGVAGCIHVSGNRTTLPQFDGSAANVIVGSEGTVSIYNPECEIGQGSNTLFAQIVAEELGIGLHRIKIPQVDTATHPFGIGSFASRVTVLGGNAVKLAALDARNKLAEYIGSRYGVNPEEIQFDDECLVLPLGHERKKITFEKAVELYSYTMGGAHLIGTGNFQPPNAVYPGEDKYGNISANYAFAAHIAEVEVDVEMGLVEIKKYWAVHDVGKALNPAMARGQVEGGIAQGMGYALTEELKIDLNGKILNPNFHDYKLPTFPDMPEIHVDFVETNDPLGPYGAKSVGEAAIVPVAPAIINAVCNALGKQLFSVPLKQEIISELNLA